MKGHKNYKSNNAGVIPAAATFTTVLGGLLIVSVLLVPVMTDETSTSGYPYIYSEPAFLDPSQTEPPPDSIPEFSGTIVSYNPNRPRPSSASGFRYTYSEPAFLDPSQTEPPPGSIPEFSGIIVSYNPNRRRPTIQPAPQENVSSTSN